MISSLANVTIPVRDYDVAIRWYTDVMGLEIRMDGSMGGDYRFVTVGIPGQNDVSIVLHRVPEPPAPGSAVVHALLFHTDDCRGLVGRLRDHGAKISLEPEEQMWGVQAVFEDPFGNSIVLLEPSPMALQGGPGGD